MLVEGQTKNVKPAQTKQTACTWQDIIPDFVGKT